MDCNGGVVHGMDSLKFLCTADGTVSHRVLAFIITVNSIRPHAEGSPYCRQGDQLLLYKK